jgi:hypothetical protein
LVLSSNYFSQLDWLLLFHLGVVLVVLVLVVPFLPLFDCHQFDRPNDTSSVEANHQSLDRFVDAKLFATPSNLGWEQRLSGSKGWDKDAVPIDFEPYDLYVRRNSEKKISIWSRKKFATILIALVAAVEI